MKTKNIATTLAILAAALYAINVPISKLLMEHIGTTMMAGLLYLGAAKTSAYYSVAPFLGVAFSMLFVGERPGWQFYIALFIMIVSTVIMVKDTIELQHIHEHEHIHTHDKDEEQHTHKHITLENHDHVHLTVIGAGSVVKKSIPAKFL